MYILATISALFGAANLAVGPLPAYVAASGLVLTAVLYVARGISPYLRIFVVMYALGYLVLAAATLAAGSGILPNAVAELVPPAFTAPASVGFALLVLGASRLKTIRVITDLADPYFSAATPPSVFGRPFGWLGRLEGQVGGRLVALLVAINFVQVAMTIRFNVFSRDLFNALQEKNAVEFWHQILGIFAPLAAIWIAIAVYEVYVDRSLHIRWRTWMTQRMASRWLDDGTHYRIPLLGLGTDNPDQRIQSDIRLFVDQTMRLSINLLSQAATLVSFLVVLWGLSNNFVLPFTEAVIPGFLVWLVVAYAIVGTWLTHILGRPLIRLDFRQETVEADYRFSLARLREYGEQVALLRGERAEKDRLGKTFSGVVANFLQILSRRMKLTTFTAGYEQLSVVFPYVLAAPSYFLGKITLGVFQQNAGAFGRVQAALSFFITSYETLASFRANIDRLRSFEAAMVSAEAANLKAGLTVDRDGPGREITLANLRLDLPDGRRIVAIDDLRLNAGSSVLVTGPSGSGKSTLFRAISGIWPFGAGHVGIPAGNSLMLAPQRPYLPSGTLRAALSYPDLDTRFSDGELRDVLAVVGLGQLSDQLDLDHEWAHRLSGGEQQRVAIARALLAKPDWLLLDEATASLDEPSEAAVYRMLSERLPNTTIVSIGHRSTLTTLHERRLSMVPAGEGAYSLSG